MNFLFQKPVNELGKSYVDFMRGNLEQLRHRITDELYILNTFEVGVGLIITLINLFLRFKVIFLKLVPICHY
jgi:hypothetical protein